MSMLRRVVSSGLIAAALAAAPAWTQEGADTLRALSEERADYRQQDQGQVREVRLALVCYGGSSLAIYIHGNTKEVLRLVKASKALQQDSEELRAAVAAVAAAPAGGRVEPGEQGRNLTGSTRQWYEVLLQKWVDDPQQVRTRVIVDIVAGTSAGGINGVVLAKALAHDLAVDDLTWLWLDKASLAKLTNHYFGLFRILAGKAPVDGDALVTWLYEALNSMDREDSQRGGRTPSLLPAGDRLDLFVTTTDRFGYPQNLVVGDPASAVEKRYRHVMHFVYPGVNRGCGPEAQRPAGEIDFFCPEWTPALAFAARASSSIPGVFPPLNLGETMKTLKKAAAAGPPPGNTVVPVPPDRVVNRLFRNYELQESDEKDTFAINTFFVDGGVLDNHPFGPAIGAILNRPQSQEVRRYLVYLQPDPGTPPTGQEKVKDPGLLKTIWAGLSGIPSGQPILDNLNDIVDHETAVDRVRDIVQAEEQAARQMEGSGAVADCSRLNELPVAQRFGCAMGIDVARLAEAMRQATPNDLQQVRRRLERTAERGVVDVAGMDEDDAEPRLDSAGRSYINLRVHSVLAQFVTVLSGPAGCNYPEDTAQRELIRKIIEGWAADEKLIGLQETPAAQRAQIAQQRRFLEDFDAGYQRRQLRFVIAWIDAQYTQNPTPEKRQLLDELKRTASDRAERLTSLVNGTSSELSRELAGVGQLFCGLRPWQLKDGQTVPLDDQKAAFLAHPGNKAALSALRENLGQALRRQQQQVRDESLKEFKRLASRLSPAEQREILVRYFGFPFWDRQIYPYVAFSGLGEFQSIDVYRLSPDDATLLGRRTARDKLVGATKAHFGAFLSRPGRESDYLWGRLDAGDRLLKLLGAGTSGAKELFHAIVAEEGAAGLVRPSILAERQTEIDRLP